jgi:predicted Fe-Mo cluster-binding NifX family protein
MKVVVSSNGPDLEAPASATFGRCPIYLFVDTESMEFESTPNPACEAPGGAGIRAAQFVTGSDVQAVITGRVGPNATNVLQAAGMPVYLFPGGTVRQAVEDFNAGKLSADSVENVRSGQGKKSRLKAKSPRYTGSREDEIATLRAEAMDVRDKLAKVLVQIDRLQED